MKIVVGLSGFKHSSLLIATISLLMVFNVEAVATLDERIAAGKALAYDRNAGNCLSCHVIPGSELPGNIGPPLMQMKLRFPERDKLKAQIVDAGVRNPDTVMPPYGRHNILSDTEIELLVDFIHSI